MRMSSLFKDFNKVDIAIERLKTFEPEEGFYLAFSGGKDSIVLYDLALKAGVKFDSHFNLTTVDPPELLQYIKKNYPMAKIELPKKSMRALIIERRCPPLRTRRYCCEELKERGGYGRFVLTGIRAEESKSRSGRRLVENCKSENKKILHPIIDWTEQEIWDYIFSNKLPYCKLYDEGFKRIGCIGCPCPGVKEMKRDFARWPKFYQMYINSFDMMVKKMIRDGLKTPWKNGIEVYRWWVKESKTFDGGLFPANKG
jgi:phosphoadenosine phosphosulfate reductase